MSFDLIVKGNGFHPTSLVHMNGRPLPTVYVTRTELRARVDTSDIPTEGTYAITVFTPWPGGGPSRSGHWPTSSARPGAPRSFRWSSTSAIATR